MLLGRWLTNAAGMAGRGPGVEGMGCVTAGPALVGLCCTQETTSGAVPAQQYANCSKEPTVKASASSPYSLSKRTSRLPAVTHISCHGSAGSKDLAWALCIASGHAARPKDTSANFSAALGADASTASHRPSQPLISHGRSPNGTFFLKRTMDLHWFASCLALAAAPPSSSGVQASQTEPHGRAAVPHDPGVHTVGRRQTSHVAPGGAEISV